MRDKLLFSTGKVTRRVVAIEGEKSHWIVAVEQNRGIRRMQFSWRTRRAPNGIVILNIVSRKIFPLSLISFPLPYLVLPWNANDQEISGHRFPLCTSILFLSFFQLNVRSFCFLSTCTRMFRWILTAIAEDLGNRFSLTRHGNLFISLYKKYYEKFLQSNR